MVTDARSILGWFPPNREWVPSLRYLLRRARVIELIRDATHAAPGSVLEIGCGSGALLVELATLGHSCAGMETSRKAFEVAERLLGDSGSGAQVFDQPQPGWQRAHDIVAALDVLEHIEDDAAALAQWREWLTDGGSLVLSVPAHPSWFGPGDEWAGHYRRYTRRSLVELLDRAGLCVAHFECYGFPLANLTELVGRPYYRIQLRKRLTAGTRDRGFGNAASGVERSTYRRLLPGLASPIGLGMFRLAMKLQYAFRNTDLGSGYIVVASRK